LSGARRKAAGLAELAKQGVLVSDQVVRDLDIPIMTHALRLMDTVFSIADGLGVGSEVRDAVYAIRTAGYFGTTLGSMLGVPAGAGAAAAGATLAGVGGVAALGAIGVVAAVLGGLFGGDDDEAEQRRVKQAQRAALHLRDRLTLEDFAREQDASAAEHTALSWLPWLDMEGEKKKAAVAVKLAAHFRAVDAQVPAAERDVYESISNLARWTAALDAYKKRPQAEKDAFDVLFGTTAPRLPYQLGVPLKKERARLAALAPPPPRIVLKLPGAQGGGFVDPTVVGGARSIPMTSQGILDFVSELESAAERMDLEAKGSTVLGQSWWGPWIDYLTLKPFSDSSPVRGLLDLVGTIRGPMHIINATADFQRLNRFNKRLQAHWDSAAAKGQKWKEPRPDDATPGGGGGTSGDTLIGGALALLLLFAAVALARR